MPTQAALVKTTKSTLQTGHRNSEVHVPTLLPLLELAAFLTVPKTGARISTAETVLDILVCSLLLVQPLNPPCIAQA